ncbi:MAG: S8 family peptidase [Candidatus Dormibacteria bacterium]
MPDNQVIVAVIDTGIDPTHPEFGGYRGQPGVSDPQVVAWYDLADDGTPAPGVTWDPANPIPSDACPGGDCHGTGTASIVGGSTLGSDPGVKLAVARVADGAGNLVNIPAAIDWVVKTVGADVVTMSLATIVPITGLDGVADQDLVPLREAERAGTFTVAAAGNGIDNQGVGIGNADLGARYPAEGSSPAYLPSVLSVGATTETGDLQGTALASGYSNTDPDVAAWGTDARLAVPGGGYGTGSGTSFATPRVAGYGARVMEAAIRAEGDASPAAVRALLESAARADPAIPYALEGFGVLDEAAAEVAVGAAGSGAALPAPGADRALAHQVAITARTANTTGLVTLTAATGQSTPGHMDASTGPARQVHPYPFLLSAGQWLHVAVTWNDPSGQDVALPEGFGNQNLGTNDLDLFLYGPGAGAGGVWQHTDLAALNSNPSTVGPNEEDLDFRAAQTGSFTLMVEGYLVRPGGQAYSVFATVDGLRTIPGYPGNLIGVIGKNA